MGGPSPPRSPQGWAGGGLHRPGRRCDPPCRRRLLASPARDARARRRDTEAPYHSRRQGRDDPRARRNARQGLYTAKVARIRGACRAPRRGDSGGTLPPTTILRWAREVPLGARTGRYLFAVVCWIKAMMLPSVSLNHADFAPPAFAMPPFVLSPGMSYSSKT